MKNRYSFKNLVLFISILLVSVFPTNLASGKSANLESDFLKKTVKETVLQATVEIKISVTRGSDGEQILEARGLGSLVQSGKEVLLVTHNHWGEVLQEMAVVEFRDSQGRLQKMMFGSDFQNLVVYQDAGTLVLHAPEEVSRSGSKSHALAAGDSGQVKAGDTVLVVHHNGAGREGLGVFEARVESIFKYKGLPAFNLRSQAGETVVQGDSGGGVWKDGQLVGNLWATVNKEAAKMKSGSSKSQAADSYLPTDTSYSAIFPNTY